MYTVPDHASKAFATEWAGYIDGLKQECSNSSALAMESPQSYTKPSMYVLLVENARYISVLLNIEYWQG